MTNYALTVKNNLNSIIKKMAHDPSDFVKNPDTDFTRNRKLSFETMIKFLLSMGGNSLSKELMDYWSMQVISPIILQTKRRQTTEIQWITDKNPLLKNSELKGEIYITKRSELSIKIDYLSMVFETMDARELIQRVLGLPFEFFNQQEARIKHKAYTRLYQCGMIKIYSDMIVKEEYQVGSYLVLSGSACDAYYDCMSRQGVYEYSFGNFFWECNKLVGSSNFHLTRLDIAIDDKNAVPYFTIEQIKKKCLKDEFVSQSRSYRFSESSFADGTAKTVYIGGRKSNLSYRFYDKDKEVSGKYEIPYEEIGSWKRTELQLRDDIAHGFAMLFADNPEHLGKLTFDLLGSSLRFVTEDNQQSNKSRLKTSQFWERFLGAIEPLKIKAENSTNSLYETQRWYFDVKPNPCTSLCNRTS